jgi:2-polyprenyl-3-methyl-5-hydroxy-6-metoxy-1,4-benzoquinol methylase
MHACIKLDGYRQNASEQARTQDLLNHLPSGKSALDIGARDGHFSQLLAERFQHVTALDLVKPDFEFPGVETVAGDITELAFPENSFDCVFCAEVLEHIPQLHRACAEIKRVARRNIVIGVPFDQDIRLGRTTCMRCGRVNPPWGHVNSFTEARLLQLFPHLTLVSQSFVGESRDRTSSISAALMQLGGNPWGTYDQEEACIHCGARVIPPLNRSILRRLCSGAAARLDMVQRQWTRPRAIWIHLVFEKSTSDIFTEVVEFPAMSADHRW